MYRHLVPILAVLILGSPVTVRAQVNYAWNVGNGNWATAGSWTPAGGPPGSSDNATISIAGTYTATLNDINRAINNLTLNNATATLSQSGGRTLTVGGTVALTAGNYIINDGTISGGSITSAGGLLKPQGTGAILNNVTVGLGVLDFSTFSTLRLQGTSTLAAGTTLSLNAGSRIGFQQTTTLDNLTVNMAGFLPSFSVEGNNTLTIGSLTTITSTTGAGANLTSGQFVSGTGIIQNQGTIQTTGSGALTISPTTFRNLSGGIVQAPGGTMQINNGGIINQAGGSFNANGGTFILLGAIWVNQGTITLSSGTLQLGGTFTTAGIGTLTRTGGIVQIIGAMDNSSATLALNAATGSYQLTQNGSITGGSITSSDGKQLQLASGNNNLLNNVAIGLGVLNFDTFSGRVRLQGTSNLAAGTILNLNGAINIIGFQQTTTLNDLTVNLNTSASALSVDGNNTLTLGSSTTVTGTGGSVSLSSGVLAAGTGVLQNQGLIRNDLGNMTINPATFTNQPGGIVRASGGTISIPDATTLTNVVAGTLTDGTWEVKTNATLDFGSRTISTIGPDTTVELNGPNSTFNALNSLTNNNGTLRVVGNRNFAPTSGAITVTNTSFNNGNVEVISATSTITANLTMIGGTLRGGGTVAGNVTFSQPGSTLLPGVDTTTGVLTVTGSLAMNVDTTVRIKVNGNTAGTGYDQIKANGVTLGDPGDPFSGAFLDPFSGTYAPVAGDLLFIVNNTSGTPIVGTFYNRPDQSEVTVNGVRGFITYFGNANTMSITGGNDVVLYGFTPVPEPTTVLGVAAFGLVVLRALRRRSAEKGVGSRIE